MFINQDTQDTGVCVHKFTQHVQQRSCTNSQHKTTRAVERRLEHCLLFSTGLMSSSRQAVDLRAERLSEM
jgi:hypothetical protein